MFGIHIHKKGDYSAPANDALQLMRNLGYVGRIGMQLYVTSPRTGGIPTIEDNEIAKLRAMNGDVAFIIHGAMVDNPWSKSSFSIHNIKSEMIIAEKLGATGVIIHLTSLAAESMEWFIEKMIEHVPAKVRKVVTIWLEIGVKRPDTNGPDWSDPEELRELFGKIDVVAKGKLRVGLCFDTAHLWSCGMSMQYSELAQSWLDDISEFMIKRIGELSDNLMIHLNDSGAKFASGMDRHFKLLDGQMWGNFKHETIGRSGLFSVVSFATVNNLMCILETPTNTSDEDLALIAKIK